ncbi:MAG: Gfo/Idh/MocA family oxidoreductase, partial [Candidatus Omnitrophica bacterium]|nr:Gfo/Idh/MocA family oxidoreductase [Candidatus Omnitrophota bacterium]
VFFSKEDALQWMPQITFITNPATRHIDTALIFAKGNSHLFIEKPLSVNEEGLQELIEEVNKRRLIVMVGYVLRFSKALQTIKKALGDNLIGKVLSIRVSAGQNLLNWRPSQRYQDTVSARADLGGGACFELSHELDYVSWLIGEVTDIHAFLGKVSDLEIDVEDLVEISLKFKSGAFGSVHLDMIDHAANRYCRIVGVKGTLLWDSFDGGSVRFFSSETGSWQELLAVREAGSSEMYKAELEHFFNCLASGSKPTVSLEEAKEVIRLVNTLKASAKTKERVSL